MSTLTWSPTSSPVDLTRVPAMDNSTFFQAGVDDCHTSGMPVTTQNMQDLDTAAWLSVTEGPVDLGLSSLSHECQSTCTLNSFSDPDGYTLPPSVDLPFTTEPAWNGAFVFTSPDVSSQTSPEFGLPTSFDQNGLAFACSSSSVEVYPGSFPMFFPHGGQVAYSRNVAHTSPRVILPRTQGLAVPIQPIYGPQRELRPNVPGSRRSQAPARSVSNTAGSSQDTSGNSMPPASTSSQPEPKVSGQAGTSFPSVADPTAEEFSAFIRCDQDDHLTLEGASKRTYKRGISNANGFVPGFKVLATDPSLVPVDRKPALSDLNVDVSKPLEPDAENVAITSLPSEIDEGRHRTHPDYSQPPHPDGLYRCPYKAKENCSHKPTKLKCNYEYEPVLLPSASVSNLKLTTLLYVVNTSTRM